MAALRRLAQAIHVRPITLIVVGAFIAAVLVAIFVQPAASIWQDYVRERWKQYTAQSQLPTGDPHDPASSPESRCSSSSATLLTELAPWGKSYQFLGQKKADLGSLAKELECSRSFQLATTGRGLCLQHLGLDLMFDEADRLDTIIFSAVPDEHSHSPYTGELPLGIHFDETRARVRDHVRAHEGRLEAYSAACDKIGPPESCDKFELARFTLHVQYNSPGGTIRWLRVDRTEDDRKRQDPLAG